jgi:hypothetical protein
VRRKEIMPTRSGRKPRITAEQRRVLGDVMRALGSAGGKASAASLTKRQRVARAKKASAASHAKKNNKQ